MRTPLMPSLLAAALVVGGAAAAQAAVAPRAPAPAPAAAASAPAPAPMAPVPPHVLLDKRETDVLGKRIVYPAQTPAQVTSTVITLVPGQRTGRHRHDAPMYAYILAGALTVRYDGGRVKVYRAGQAIMEAQGTWHDGVNGTRRPVKVLVVNMGAAGVANTVRP